MKTSELYMWEFELNDGVTYQQYDEAGNERPSTIVLPQDVIRISIVPRIPIFPRHDCFIDHTKGELFVRRFGRGIMKVVNGEYRCVEYLHCVVTSNYRLYVLSSNGRVVVTDKDYELYL